LILIVTVLFWVPKSQVTVNFPVEKNSQQGTLELPVWLAKKVGLWGYTSFGDPVCSLVEEEEEEEN
jgi:hypothetical protein